MVEFNGDLDMLDFLKYDVTNVAHYLKSDAKVLVIGPGGGRDILTALAFGQKSVLGVEINGDIVDTVNDRFVDFTGHLDRHPKVSFVVDEARSYIARQKDKFDIIQSSLIDSYAATAAGAFVLTENTLYTVEAWQSFLQHLDRGGILTFSRWYWEPPGEVYRLTSLASAALLAVGAEDPRDHIIIVRNMIRPTIGVGTIMVGIDPFDQESLNTIEEVADRMKFEIVLSPRLAVDDTYARLASGRDLDALVARFPINIAAPTGDSPFFFNMLRLRDIFKPSLWKREFARVSWDQRNAGLNTKPILILGSLLVIVVMLTTLCIIVPLALTTDTSTLRGCSPHFLFFTGIGFGFMLIEISQMQRLAVFLGHPTYSLSVVLFSLLIASGIGSYSTQRIDNPHGSPAAVTRLALLLAVLLAFGALTPFATNAFRGSTTPVRIAIATGLLLPLGFFMGMAFPLGMKLAARQSTSVIPWLWGLNGAASVCASVLAIVLALSAGISTAFWTGFVCYVIAFGAFLWAGRRSSVTV